MCSSIVYLMRLILYSLFVAIFIVYFITLHQTVSNIVKRGIAPIITIKSQRLKDKIELRFKDNGKGIDLEKNCGPTIWLIQTF